MTPQSETEPPGLWSYLGKAMIVIVVACIIIVLVGPDAQAMPLAYLGIALGGVVWLIPLIRHVAALFRTPPPPQRSKVQAGQVYLVRSKVGTTLLTAGQELPPESQDTVVQELWAGKPIRVDIDRNQLYSTNDDKVVSCTLTLCYTFEPGLVDENVLPMLDRAFLEKGPTELGNEIKNLLTVFFEEHDQKQVITQGHEPLRAKVRSLFDRYYKPYGLTLMPDFQGVNLQITHPPGYVEVLNEQILNHFRNSTGYSGFDWRGYGDGSKWPAGGSDWGTGGGRSGGRRDGADWETRHGGSTGIGGLPKTSWNDFKRSMRESIADFTALDIHFRELVEICSVKGALLDDLERNGIHFDGVTLSELALHQVDYRGVPRDRMVQMRIRLDS